MINTLQAILRVANGKEAVDHSPDTLVRWREHIDVEKLDLSDFENCILGQQGNYQELLGRLSGYDQDKDVNYVEWAIEHGFEQDFDAGTGFDPLQDAWLVVIEAR
jgi:hypothetical protein